MLTIAILCSLGLMLGLFAAGDRSNFSGDVSFTAPTGGYTRGKIYQLSSGA